MKLLKGLSLLLFTTFLLTACGEPEIKNSSMEETAETFVQALIDGDEKVIDELNHDAQNPTSEIMQKHAPKFSGKNIEDIKFEVLKESDEVEIEYVDSDGSIRYWFTIEKIGEEYFVTYL